MAVTKLVTSPVSVAAERRRALMESAACTKTIEKKKKTQRRTLPWNISGLSGDQCKDVVDFRFLSLKNRAAKRLEVKKAIDVVASKSTALSGPHVLNDERKRLIHTVLYGDRTTGDADEWFEFLTTLLTERATQIKKAHKVDKSMLATMPSVEASCASDASHSDSDDDDDDMYGLFGEPTLGRNDDHTSPRTRLRHAMEEYKAVCHAVSLVVGPLFKSSIVGGLARREFGWPLEETDPAILKLRSMCACSNLPPIVDVAWAGPCE